jgi:hypothetical protein
MFSSREETRSAPRLWRERAGRALGLARAYLLPEADPDADAGWDDAWEASSAPGARHRHRSARGLASAPPAPAAPPHPHRRPLQTTLGPRRPGAGSPRVQLCATPLEAAPPRRLRPAGTAARDEAARR